MWSQSDISLLSLYDRMRPFYVKIIKSSQPSQVALLSFQAHAVVQYTVCDHGATYIHTYIHITDNQHSTT